MDSPSLDARQYLKVTFNVVLAEAPLLACSARMPYTVLAHLISATTTIGCSALLVTTRVTRATGVAVFRLETSFRGINVWSMLPLAPINGRIAAGNETARPRATGHPHVLASFAEGDVLIRQSG
jgi:hypothetical protein